MVLICFYSFFCNFYFDSCFFFFVVFGEKWNGYDGGRLDGRFFREMLDCKKDREVKIVYDF